MFPTLQSEFGNNLKFVVILQYATNVTEQSSDKKCYSQIALKCQCSPSRLINRKWCCNTQREQDNWTTDSREYNSY